MKNRLVLLRDRTGVDDIENHLGEIRPRWLGHLERMDEKTLLKEYKEEKKEFQSILKDHPG